MIGVISGPKTSFLDHLVPLCHILKIPLYCQDPYVRHMAEIFYPEISLTKSCKEKSTFFYVEPSKMGHGGFSFEKKSKGRGVCGFHGNSEKNRNAFWIERYADEDVVLYYGDFFLDFMKEKGVYPRLKKLVRTGNYRALFYQEHRSFFQNFFPPVPTGKKRVLYAPTWTFDDKKSKEYSSIFEIYPFILDCIPDGFEVVVKLHPYLFRMYPEKVEMLKKKYEGRPEIIFLDEIPLIYPLLETVDIYLGDFSSVSYDFLKFNRPLFFLNDSDLGRVIKTEELPKLYSILDEKDRFEETRKKAYHYAFGEEISLENLRSNILEALQ